HGVTPPAGTADSAGNPRRINQLVFAAVPHVKRCRQPLLRKRPPLKIAPETIGGFRRRRGNVLRPQFLQRLLAVAHLRSSARNDAVPIPDGGPPAVVVSIDIAM